MFIDFHCDTLLGLTAKPNENRLLDYSGHVSLEKMMAGNALAQCFAIFTPSGQGLARFSPDPEKPLTAQEFHELALASYRREMAKNADKILPAYTVEDILRNKENGKMSAILTIEDLTSCEGKAERFDQYYEEGVRIMGFIWNYENSLAYPNSKDPEIMAKGLKPFGIEMVEKMNNMGIIMDVSHLNDGGFWDVIKYSKQPFVATHSNARAVTNHTRNLTDEMLKALAEKGGLTGLNFWDALMREPNEEKFTRIEDVMRHAQHIVNVAGEDALAMGSDYDGIGSTLEWKDWSGMPALAERLATVFTEDQVDKICYKNALRVMKDVWGK